MGFFKNLTTETVNSDDVRVRAYLAEGRAGPRTEWLMWSAVLRIAETPIAASEKAGTVVTMPGLTPASQIVREMMVQDRDLSAWIARKAIVNLKNLFSGPMTGDFDTDFERGFAAMGLESPARPGGVIFKSDAGAGILESDADAAKAMADIVIELMKILVTPVDERPQLAGWKLFVDLYTGASGEDVETTAYDLTAWVAVLVARLQNTGQFTKPIPFLAPEWKHVPRLTEAGWYPNPGKHGEIIEGVAAFQRYWDGSAWTDQVRARDGGDWQMGMYSLHDPPTD